MKFATDCVRIPDSGAWVFATYEHTPEKRRGRIVIENSAATREIHTTGTFDLTVTDKTIFASNTDGLSIYNINTLEKQTHFETGLSYKHSLCGSSLASASSSGTFFELDLEKEAVTKKKLHCNGQDCIHDVFSVHLTPNSLYIGCDIGTLSVIDRRSGELSAHALDGGVTWIGPQPTPHQIEVGTYHGEYYFINGETVASRKKTPGIIWRIHPVEISGALYKIASQSFDGVGIYNSAMELIKLFSAKDLVYCLKIEGEEKDATFTGYNYYSEEIVQANIYNAIQDCLPLAT